MRAVSKTLPNLAYAFQVPSFLLTMTGTQAGLLCTVRPTHGFFQALYFQCTFCHLFMRCELELKIEIIKSLTAVFPKMHMLMPVCVALQ